MLNLPAIRPWLRIDNDEPMCSELMIDTPKLFVKAGLPTINFPTIDMLEPILTAQRQDMEDPIDMKSRTEALLPSLAVLLIEMDEPRLTKLMTLAE
jgi:hypothetical protein